METQVILHGTGGAEILYKGMISGQEYKRKHPAVLVKTKAGEEVKYIQIDYTLHADTGLLKAGIAPSLIDYLVFSHTHEDHFVPYRFLAGKIGSLHLDPKFSEKPLWVYGPDPAIEALNSMLITKGHQSSGEVERDQISCIVFKNENSEKEIIFLYKAQSNEVLPFTPNIELKFIGARHLYETAYSSKGKGKVAFGFLITVKEDQASQSIFYLPDYAEFEEEEKNSLFQSFEGYQLDLAIFGMPIPFPSEKKRGEHMGLISLLNLFKELRDKELIKKDGILMLTHLNDQWESPEVLAKVKKIIKDHQMENLIWIPKEDGFEILVKDNKISHQGKFL